MKPIRLILADDHPLILDALENLFHLEADCEVVARCRDGEEALTEIRRYQPDVVILDIRMPRIDGLAVLRELKQEGFPTRVVLLTAAANESDVLEAVRLGVDGVVLKDMASQALLQCVRQVNAGGQWIEPRFLHRALDKALRRETGERELRAVLTPRELDIVRMVVCGLRNKEVAKRLYISEGTVKIHLHNIYDKLQVSSRLELLRYVQDKGLT
ncbi:MAG: response regulator [Candidatus Binatia bacterium]